MGGTLAKLPKVERPGGEKPRQKVTAIRRVRSTSPINGRHPRRSLGLHDCLIAGKKKSSRTPGTKISIARYDAQK